MLPAAQRIRRPADFRTVLRGSSSSGGARARAGGDLLVLHVRIDDATDRPARLGLVVAKSVGTAVVRNRVSRRLRHLMAPRLAELPPGSDVVIRALPPAAEADSGRLAAEVDRLLSRCRHKMRSAS